MIVVKHLQEAEQVMCHHVSVKLVAHLRRTRMRSRAIHSTIHRIFHTLFIVCSTIFKGELSHFPWLIFCFHINVILFLTHLNFYVMAKYSKESQHKVEENMKEMKQGKLKSGRSNKKVTNPKQAIAIGLSEARKEGAKVPKKAAAKKSTPKKSAAKKAAPKKAAAKKSSAKKTTAKKAAPKKAAARKTTAKKSTAKKSTARKTTAKKAATKKAAPKRKAATRKKSAATA
ncbi:DUF6496 domain-containing protein [Chitinophaga sp.]|uniref:DUF6496 domain-containing protein n=1 Tax=Chitinophaga sp. TaxID=1869181 RepID=UPI002BE51A22|nr:DUF6496 domain-containing protein [Chitinophaga sp.]HWV67386.1 DUF6496 domain-containing protein [Chitinophaga sp.]